jgi:hypothetical protein
VLSLDLLLAGVRDVEAAQYRILAQLQECRTAFARNVIYPYLGTLVQVHTTLADLIRRFDEAREQLGQKKIVLEDGVIVVRTAEMSDTKISTLKDLATWTLPLLQQAIEEGKTVFEFVDENLHLEEVGIVPAYVEEGYLMIPDRRGAELHVLQYSLSIFAGAGERYRTLKTSFVKSIPCPRIEKAPATIKMDLVAEGDLPNPATYLFQTDLDFPFVETLLPVAKRKLMRYLYAAGQA